MANTDFYNNFIRLCNRNNEKPSSVLDKLGIHRSLLTRWKNGSIPRSTTVQKIADFFEVDTEELLQPYFIKVPTETLEVVPQYINAIAEILADTGGIFAPARATEEEWKEQLDKCSLNQLFEIQRMLTETIQKKTGK